MSMKPFDEYTTKRAALLKAARTAIRLKHSLAADAEIAAKLPELEARVNEALTLGQPLEINAGALFDEV